MQNQNPLMDAVNKLSPQEMQQLASNPDQLMQFKEQNMPKLGILQRLLGNRGMIDAASTIDENPQRMALLQALSGK